MEADNFEKQLEEAKAALGVSFQLKDLQKEALFSFLCGKDTFCLLPTSYGKSIIYQMTPFLTGGCCLVIGPLSSILKDQVIVNNFRSTSFNASIRVVVLVRT